MTDRGVTGESPTGATKPYINTPVSAWGEKSPYSGGDRTIYIKFLHAIHQAMTNPRHMKLNDGMKLKGLAKSENPRHSASSATYPYTNKTKHNTIQLNTILDTKHSLIQCNTQQHGVPCSMVRIARMGGRFSARTSCCTRVDFNDVDTCPPLLSAYAATRCLRPSS